MASKKFTLLVSLVIAGATVGYSQLGGGLNYQDSTKINKKKLPQYNEWKNNTNAFPPVPKAMGQLSIYGGTNWFDGDCPSQPGWQVGASYRKALGYILSLRGSISYGESKGMDYRQSRYLYNNNALNVYSTQLGGQGYYVHNFKTTMINGSIDMVASLNNIMFHRSKSKLNATVFVGYSPFVYNTKMDVLAGSSRYNYTTNAGAFFGRPRKDVISDLKGILDGDYETYARVNDRSQNFDDPSPSQSQWRHAFSFGGGFEYRIGSRVSLGLDARYLMTNDDYIDGWYLGQAGALTPDKDNILYTNLSINFNL